MNITELQILYSVQGDGAGSGGGQGGAGGTAPTAGRNQSCHKGNDIHLELRSDQSVWLFSALIPNSDSDLCDL